MPGCNFQARGKTERIVKTALQRHRREKHSEQQDALERRRQQQRKRIADVRSHASVPAPAALASASAASVPASAASAPAEVIRKRPSAAAEPAPLPAGGQAESACLKRPAAAALQETQIQHIFVVTAPADRESFWEQARAELMRLGVPVSGIMRRKGIPFAAYQEQSPPLRDSALPTGLQPHTFLHFDFSERFIPWCGKHFRQHPDTDVIWWCEDDIRFHGNVSVLKMIEEASSAPAACLLWFGYGRHKGQARWGSHLTGVTRRGYEQLRQMICDSRAGDGVAHLKGLDTWLHELLRDTTAMSGAIPWVWVAPESWAGQRSHERKGRR